MTTPDDEDPAPPADESSGTDIRAVSRVAQILGLFSSTLPEINATTVAQQLGMNRTTAYRYCMSLAAARLLDRLDTGMFVPGRLLMQLGAYALGRRDILSIAPRYLRALSDATTATTALSLWGATGPIVSAIAEEPRPTALVTVRVGTHLPATSAQAHVFYAFHPDQLYIAQLMANLPAPEHDQLAAQVRAVRRAGYAAAVNHRGIAVLAAPVFDTAGLCAALAIVSTRDALSTDPTSAELRALRTTADQLTAEMSGTPAPRPQPTTTT